MTVQELLKNYNGGNAQLSIEGYCEEEYYDFCTDEEAKEKLENPDISNGYHFLIAEPWWNEIKNSDVKCWNILMNPNGIAELWIEPNMEQGESNQYREQAEVYRQLLNTKKIPADNAEYIEHEIKILDMIAELDIRDINSMFDTGAFNDVTKAYINKALEILPQEQAESVIDELNMLLDTKRAWEMQ